MLRFSRLFDAFAIGLMALAILLICSRFVDGSRIHVSGLDDTLNDQVIYISTARQYVETGNLQSDITYPATLYQHTRKNSFYLPGHFLALALSYKLFGLGVFQSLLPNLVSFILSAIGIFLTAAKLYSRRVGYLAAFFFTIFPANVIYAFTAMSESTRTAVTILAFCIFIYLPDRWRPLGGVFLLVLPFLFRETGAFVVIPMALIILWTKGAHRAIRTGAFVLASVLVLFITYNSDLASGRPNLLNAIVFDPTFATIHTDAVAQQAVASKTATEWIGTVPHKMLNDGALLVDQVVFHQSEGRHFEDFSFAALVIAAVAAFVFGVLERDAFLIGTGGLVATTILMLLVVYIPSLGGYVRWLLFTFAFSAVGLAWVYTRHISPRIFPRFRIVSNLTQVTLLILLCGASLYGIYRTAYRVGANDARDDHFTACIEQLGLDDKKMLVAPYYMGDYIYHHATRASFVPANKATLSLLQADFDIGAVIVRTPDGESLEGTALTSRDLGRSGLPLAQKMNCNDEEFLVFRSLAE